MANGNKQNHAKKRKRKGHGNQYTQQPQTEFLVASSSNTGKVVPVRKKLKLMN